MSDSSEVIDGDSSFFLLGGIPGNFRSYHLRAYFSHLVDRDAFTCFHFRHRPEYHRKLRPVVAADTTESEPPPRKQETTEQTQNKDSLLSVDDATGCHDDQPTVVTTTAAGTTCCVLAIKSKWKSELLKYRGRHWTDLNEELMRGKVKLQHIMLTEKESGTTESSEVATPPSFDKDLILSLPELHPPGVMPQGNVGTSLGTFRELIRTCRLPPHVIRKLKLVFPSSVKRYGAVPLDYGCEERKQGRSLSDMRLEQPLSGKKQKKVKRETVEDDLEQQEEINENDDFDAEEWERYEALHNDVDKQERTGERLFEEEMEVVWDKGSSGLVFYTDASYWDQLDGDFDEKCSKEDDWDVDMSLYYGYESADKPARDMRDMNIERRLREGEDLEDIQKQYEGFGRKIMKEKGWREGSGLGRTASGISEPVEAEGQTSHCKAGLGYRGEKLNQRPAKKKRTRDVIIPTIYDKIDEEQDSVLKSAPPTTLKYRKIL